MVYDCRGFWLLDFPMPESVALSSFDDLPLDRYTPGGQRFRRFTAYRMGQARGDWAFEALPPRPFLQPKSYNALAGGVARQFEPLRIDPSAQLAAVCSGIGLDRTQDYALNVHQVRVIADERTEGVVVPEGPHRDGHRIIMTMVFARSNISGGMSQLMETDSKTPFYERELSPGAALIVEDERMWHHATDIKPFGAPRGHRDIWIVSLNPWAERRYGEQYERRAAAEATA